MEILDGGSCPGCGNTMGLTGPGGCNCKTEKVPPKKAKNHVQASRGTPMRNGDQCSNCIYYHHEGNETVCRRNPPTIQGQPSTHGDNWCGEHRRVAVASESIMKTMNQKESSDET